jgi:hypothetical protein
MFAEACFVPLGHDQFKKVPWAVEKNEFCVEVG